MTTTPLNSGLEPTHPGALLREIVLPAMTESKTAIASALGVSRHTLHDLLAEKQGVTAAMALRLGRLFGNSPEFWLAMQANHDLRRAQEDLGEALDRIPQLTAA